MLSKGSAICGVMMPCVVMKRRGYSGLASTQNDLSPRYGYNVPSTDYAARVNLYAMFARAAQRKRGYRARAQDNKDAKQKIAEPNREASGNNGQKTQRPVPVVGALLVHVGEYVPIYGRFLCRHVAFSISLRHAQVRGTIAL